jgi:hypothetical protein
MSAASCTDLFAGGLGFDIAGGYLVAKGLLTGADELARRTAASRNRDAWQRVQAADDHADGTVGVRALCLGFTLQAVGYAIQIGGASSGTDGEAARLVAIGCVLVGVAATVGLWRTTRWPLKQAFLVEHARWDRSGMRHARPYGRELLQYGQILGRATQEDVSDEAGHARRVWGVQDARATEYRTETPHDVA